ncbi:MAG: pitrilysin family protein [Thermodesulfobacteriota bacterium]|nr:pitrilysin family protein [Thermodesulfobacteriota bacterium]
MRLFRSFALSLLLLSMAWSPCPAEDSAPKIGLDVKEFELENGMLFLVVERPTTPQVACRIAIRTGSALEQVGKTGIAHLLEHMMFKGTKNFGTQDPKMDQELQERIEAAYQAVLEEQRKRAPNQALIKAKLAEMERLRLEVQEIYVPRAFSAQLGKNGAVGVNAFTSKDQTQYTVSVPSDMLEQWFSIVSEQLFEPSWREFYVEKEVVQREWAYRYVNNPGGAAQLDLHATAYTAHPYRNPVIGWKTDMEKFNTRDAMAFHATYYNPTNAVCVLVGDVTMDDAKGLAETYFARYPSGNRAPEKITAEPSQEGPRRSIRFLKGARTPIVRIGFHAAPMGTKDFYALDALTMVLSHGRGARMTQDIVNKGLAVSAWAHNPDNRYGGMVILGGSPNEPDDLKDKDLSEEDRRQAFLVLCEELEKILLEEVNKVKTESVSARELQRIKKLNQRDFLDRMRSNEALAGTLATLEVQIGWRYLKTYLEEIARVTPEEVQRVARKYIRNDNKTSIYVIPGGEPEHPPEHYAEIRSVTGSAASEMAKPEILANRSVYPTPGRWKHPLSFERKPKKIEYPEAKMVTTEGATVFYLPDLELPLVDLAILVKAGAVDVSAHLTGLSQLLDNCLIRGGTETFSPTELALLLDENAIRLALSIGLEETVIHLSVMKEDWNKGLSLLEEILVRPRFDQEALQVAKTELMTGLRRQGGNAQAVSTREATIWHFNGHPYGRDPLKGLETIPAITREDLRKFVGKYFVPSNMVVALSGDIEMHWALKGLRGLFEAFPQGSKPKRMLDEPPETPPVLALIHKPGQVQSQVVFHLPSVRRTHPDFWKMNLLMDIFGGGDSLMGTRLRDDLGLVYAAWFYQTFKWKAGMLSGYIGCKGDNTARAVEETIRIMTTLSDEVPEQRLEQKRLDALNSFVFNVDTPAALAEAYARYRMRGEPLDTLEKIQDAFIGATREELRNLADRLLDSRKLQVFVVGDRTTGVKRKEGSHMTLEKDLKNLAEKLGLPFREMALR